MLDRVFICLKLNIEGFLVPYNVRGFGQIDNGIDTEYIFAFFLRFNILAAH